MLCAVNPRFYWGYVCLLFPVTDFCFFTNVGVGGYTYLLEPLWWAGMVTSKYSNSDPTLSLSLSLSPLWNGRLNCIIALILYFNISGQYSDRWRGCKFCGLCLCSSSSSNPTWCTEYNYQVNANVRFSCMW